MVGEPGRNADDLPLQNLSVYSPVRYTTASSAVRAIEGGRVQKPSKRIASAIGTMRVPTSRQSVVQR